MVTVMFARPMASFNESDGAYRMCVVKDRVTARRVTVTLTDAPGTAGRDEGERWNMDVSPTPLSLCRIVQSCVSECCDSVKVTNYMLIEIALHKH